MAICKECLHCKLCECVGTTKMYPYKSDGCRFFKDPSRFVELPCKVGDTVYVITYCRCANPECYDNKHCHKKETTRTPEVLASKMVQQMGRKINWNGFEHSWEWKPIGTICYRVYQKPFELKMLAEVGKTVFLSIEEAKIALTGIMK